MKLRNRFNGRFDTTDDIMVLPHTREPIFLLFTDNSERRVYRIRLKLNEAKKLQKYLKEAIELTERIQSPERR